MSATVPAGAAPASIPERVASYAERNERSLVLLLLLVSLAFQANGILHYGYLGQDFEDHIFKLMTVFDDPLFVVSTQDAPLPYYFAAGLYLLTDGRYVLELFAAAAALMNALAVYLFHRLATRLIAHVLLRLAATILLTFLPFRIVHAVVFSGDGFTPLPFIAVVLLVVGLFEGGTRQAERVRLLALVMTLALLAKHSFVAFLPALLVALVVLVRTARLGPRLAATFLVLVVALPAALGAMLLMSSSHERVHPWKKRPGTGPAMTLEDLLAPKKRDLHLLSAPSYDEKDGWGKYNLVVPHRFSYPALLHLGIWTDLLNFFQYDPERPYIPQRSDAHRQRMAISVKTGLVFSIAALLATAYYTVRSIRLFLRVLSRGANPTAREFALLAAVVFGCASYLVIVVALPYLRWAYWSGYWLPRLVMPSLLTFFLLSFVGLDAVLARRRWRAIARWIALVALLAVAAQSALHLSFLWPWGAYGPMPRIELPGYGA